MKYPKVWHLCLNFRLITARFSCVRKIRNFRVPGIEYHKVPKCSDARKLCCNLPKIQTKGTNIRVFFQKDANGLANSEDPEQFDLGLHCLPRPICPKT